MRRTGRLAKKPGGHETAVRLSDNINSPYNDYAPWLILPERSSTLLHAESVEFPVNRDAEQGDEDVYWIEKTGNASRNETHARTNQQFR